MYHQFIVFLVGLLIVSRIGFFYDHCLSLGHCMEHNAPMVFVEGVHYDILHLLHLGDFYEMSRNYSAGIDCVVWIFGFLIYTDVGYVIKFGLLYICIGICLNLFQNVGYHNSAIICHDTEHKHKVFSKIQWPLLYRIHHKAFRKSATIWVCVQE